MQEGDAGEHLGSVDDKNWKSWHAGSLDPVVEGE
jgi:hypothetical protein